MTQHMKPCPGVMTFTNLVDPSVVIITIYLVFSDPCPKVEKIFREIYQFTLFTRKESPLMKWGS